MARVPDTIRRGRLSADEMDRIDELSGRGLGAGQIALRLNRHPGTVNYAMHRLGRRKLTRRSTTYVRNGVLVKSFSAEEDALIEALSASGMKNADIAAQVSAQFGHPRTEHTINVRLVMLASAAEAA